MEKICKVCKKSKKTPYKDICKSCYQSTWVNSIKEKKCAACARDFKTPGKKCRNCLDEIRKEKSRLIECSNCKRIGFLILNKSENLCVTCDRLKKEEINPDRKETRRRQVRESSRRQRGMDINAPVRRSKGWWKTADGYILMYRALHPNANVNGCVLQHVFIMSEHLKRPLKKSENVHHINGIRDDNRIENLELWHRGQPCGQRVEEKIDWAKKFLEEYGYVVILPK